MVRLTTLAALALLATSGSAIAAERMTAEDYQDELKACQSADTTQQRDDCLRAAKDNYERGLGERKAVEDKDMTPKLDKRVADKKLNDIRDKTVPDKLKD